MFKKRGITLLFLKSRLILNFRVKKLLIYEQIINFTVHKNFHSLKGHFVAFFMPFCYYNKEKRKNGGDINKSTASITIYTI